ncbi:hypothetical protein DL89DRAFT_267635 [Linderina pennispora]|uniref:Uncharacterized protein n=1 Tax=Linderina pennispora TaxID=61395 RepID=A0A1Y1W7B1_9FUNG|nr:uncharacterized protein DL89DRAFT_267635 [Linderina pennispora]ORX69401.1 hypothetical protein DL89DRAFT_267635 [Linderina pennispora]
MSPGDISFTVVAIIIVIVSATLTLCFSVDIIYYLGFLLRSLVERLWRWVCLLPYRLSASFGRLRDRVKAAKWRRDSNASAYEAAYLGTPVVVPEKTAYGKGKELLKRSLTYCSYVSSVTTAKDSVAISMPGGDSDSKHPK